MLAGKTLKKMLFPRASYLIVPKEIVYYLLIGVEGIGVFYLIYNPKVII